MMNRLHLLTSSKLPDMRFAPMRSHVTWRKIRARSERGSSCRLDVIRNPKSLITTLHNPIPAAVL